MNKVNTSFSGVENTWLKNTILEHVHCPGSTESIVMGVDWWGCSVGLVRITTCNMEMIYHLPWCGFICRLLTCDGESPMMPQMTMWVRISAWKKLRTANAYHLDQILWYIFISFHFLCQREMCLFLHLVCAATLNSRSILWPVISVCGPAWSVSLEIQM